MSKLVGTLVMATTLLVLPLPNAVAAEFCGRDRATIVGTGGSDNLKGTPNADVISGLGGNDRISGEGGNDTL